GTNTTRPAISKLFPLIWALSLTMTVSCYFYSQGWPIDRFLLSAAIPYFFGAFFAGFVTLGVLNPTNNNRSFSQHFSISFILLAVGTIGFTAFIFYLQYLIYYSRWQAEFGTVRQLYQLFFTGIGTFYLMAITGLRALLPWGLVILILSSLYLSRGLAKYPR
ncbi:MAG: hypothetical protein V3V04_05760, partial [Rhizobiaceae bacterium]